MAEDTNTASSDASADAGATGEGGTNAGTGETSAPPTSQPDPELSRWQNRASEAQSRADRLQAEVDRLKAAPPAPAATSDSTSDEEPLTASRVMELMGRAAALTNAAAALRSDDSVKYADRSLFDRAHQFDSPEALRAAAEASHRTFEARLAELDVVPKSEAEARLAQYVEKYGELNSTPQDTSGGTPSGDPTVEEIRAMSFAEMDALEERAPGTINRVLSKAESE